MLGQHNCAPDSWPSWVRTVLLCRARLQDVANVFYALGSLGRETLEPLLGAQPLQDLLHQLLGPLQRLAGSAEPQVCAVNGLHVTSLQRACS